MEQTCWRSPSNIALVKYWGKHGNQLPANPSISFTLHNAYTETQIVAHPTSIRGGLSIDFLFDGEPNEAFANKIRQFLATIVSYFPFLHQYHLQIDSRNSFPHSAGIASSASSMSALALCLCSLEQQFNGQEEQNEAFFRKASIIARLGSGSAARSVFPAAAVWGRHIDLPNSSDEYAVPFAMHPIFHTYQDAILIVNRSEKAVSSRVGHQLMNTHPYAAVRYQQANEHFRQLIDILQNGDVEAFVPIVENEALTLHGLMMNSSPSFILLHPNTLHIIQKIRQFRQETQLPICFTLDAGPNVHILYPDAYSYRIVPFIETALLPYCEHRYWIADRVGKGATQL
jgi:diphosphomevalonate decarboxylase